MAEPSSHVAPSWRTSETVTSAGAVESRQWIELRRPLVSADEAGARELGRRYLDEIGDFTHGLVRSRRGHGSTSLVLAGGTTLLRFGPAEVEVGGDRVECRYPIVGGLLAARAGGTLVVAQRTSSPPSLELAVVGYFPRLGASRRQRSLRRTVYGSVQARAHRAISRAFLEGAAAEAGR